MIRRRLCVVVLFLLVLSPGWVRIRFGRTIVVFAAGAPELTLSMIENEQTHAVAAALLDKAYKRIGYRVEFAELPAKRALIWANEGRTDGDVARIEGTEKKYPNLVPIHTPVIRFQGVAFTRDVRAGIRRWRDLEPYRIGIVRGIRYAVIGTKGLQPLLARDMTHLFRLLDIGRIDVAVAVREAGLVEIKRNFPNKGIHVVGEPLHQAPLFHLLHKRWGKIVPQIDGILQRMQASGELEAIHRDELRKMLGED